MIDKLANEGVKLPPNMIIQNEGTPMIQEDHLITDQI